ncbi:acyl carrier protein [Streptomyces celluloflavus]|uniref:acyl carrier protein n=1 Tax=Streptomyces celluloflavus TaxID=58344 RepID=UPI0036B00748
MTTDMPAPASVSAAMVREWLVDKLAGRLGTTPADIDVDQYFDDFHIDSTEALIIAGELEEWLGAEVQTTAMWYHPTIARLAQYIEEESALRAVAG